MNQGSGDMKKLRVLDLFSGIGGFSLGLKRTGGFETVAFCELDSSCHAILQRIFPRATIHDDVQTYCFHKKEAEVIAAGWPCQDLSIANSVWGNRAGLSGERSGLYREVIRAVRVVEPDYVALENVSDLLTLGMGDVLSALAALGYDAQWHCIPASAVGAPQERDRVWIIANSARVRIPRLVTSKNLGPAGQGWPCSAADLQFIYDHPFEPGSRWPQPLIRRMDDGVSDRAHRVQKLGNGLIPGIASILGYAILESIRSRPEHQNDRSDGG